MTGLRDSSSSRASPFLACRSATGPLSRLLLGFLQAVGITLDGDDLAAVDQTIDEGDDAGGVGKDLAPLAEGFVGGQDNGFVLVAPRDDLEEEIGVASVVGEVAELVDDE